MTLVDLDAEDPELRRVMKKRILTTTRNASRDRTLVISDSARVTAREQPKSGRPARRSALRAPWRALPIERSTLVELSVAGPPKNAFVTGRLLDGRRFEMPLEAAPEGEQVRSL